MPGEHTKCSQGVKEGRPSANHTPENLRVRRGAWALPGRCRCDSDVIGGEGPGSGDPDRGVGGGISTFSPEPPLPHHPVHPGRPEPGSRGFHLFPVTGEYEHLPRLGGVFLPPCPPPSCPPALLPPALLPSCSPALGGRVEEELVSSLCFHRWEMVHTEEYVTPNTWRRTRK